MAQISQKPKRGPGRRFPKGKSGNAGGRPKMVPELREYLRAHEGPMTIKALVTTERLLGSKNQAVAARVSNDWLNKILPDATRVEEQLRAALQRLKDGFANEPEILERALAYIAGSAGPSGAPRDAGGATDGGGDASGSGGEAVRATPAVDEAAPVPRP